MAVPLDYACRVRRPSRTLQLMALGALAYPALLLLTFYGTWVAAWISLGHPPRASLDDPKSINGVVSAFYATAGILLVFSLVAFPLSAAAAVFTAAVSLAHRPSRRRAAWIIAAMAILTGVLWGGVGLIITSDPGGVMYWYMD